MSASESSQKLPHGPHEGFAAQSPVMLEFRPAHKHHTQTLNTRQQWLLTVGFMLAILVWFVWSMHHIFPAFSSKDWLRVWAAIQSKPAESGHWTSLALPLIFLLVSLCVWRWQKSLRLHVNQNGIRQEHDLPFGLGRFFGHNWAIRWTDIQSLEVRRRGGDFGYQHALPLHMVELVISLKDGSQRLLYPVFWFRPDEPPRGRLKLKRDPLVLSVENPWFRPENQLMFAQAFSNLPAVQALNRHGAAYGHGVAWPQKWPPSPLALGNQPEVTALLLGAVGLVCVGIFLMVAEPNLHLHDASWSLRLALAMGTLAIWGLGLSYWHHCRWRAKTDVANVQLAYQTGKTGQTTAQPARLSKAFLTLAAIVWVAAVMLMTEPLLVHLSRLGRDNQAHTVGFVVSGGRATPSVAEFGQPEIPPIVLPGQQSRLAHIKEGSKVNLTTQAGRWGLWAYDDQPLRQLADTQGIR